MTERVMPTRSAILLATRMPSSPFSSSKIWMMASSSEKDNVLNGGFNHLDLAVLLHVLLVDGTHHFQSDNGGAVLTDDDIVDIVLRGAAVHKHGTKALAGDLDRADNDALIALYTRLAQSPGSAD